MPDSKRHPVSHETEDDALARLRQIDALLEDGLDRYFASRYEDAIHLWTRVLFLDRSHARARAYIERARTALAELQRRSDELLQTTRDLLEQGQTDAARRLLTEAVETTGEDLHASALRVSLERHERLERVRGADSATVDETAGPHVGASWMGRRPAFWLGAVGVAAGLAGAVAAVVILNGSDSSATTPPIVVAPAVVKLPVPTTSEVALVRARTAAASGRLADALRDLDRVSSDGPDRAAADQLRIEIQRLLMASVRSSMAPTSTERVRR